MTKKNGHHFRSYEVVLLETVRSPSKWFVNFASPHARLVGFCQFMDLSKGICTKRGAISLSIAHSRWNATLTRSLGCKLRQIVCTKGLERQLQLQNVFQKREAQVCLEMYFRLLLIFNIRRKPCSLSYHQEFENGRNFFGIVRIVWRISKVTKQAMWESTLLEELWRGVESYQKCPTTSICLSEKQAQSYCKRNKKKLYPHSASTNCIYRHHASFVSFPFLRSVQ